MLLSVFEYISKITFRNNNLLVLLSENILNTAEASMEERAKKGLTALLLLFLIPLVPLLYWIFKVVYYKTIGRRSKLSVLQDMQLRLKQHEKAGEYVSAARIYEDLKDYEKAASYYEKGGDFGRAAILYTNLQQAVKAKSMYEMAGNLDMAAEVCMGLKDYDEAARIYYQIGKKLDAAQAFEKAGRRLAAVKTYREAGDYKKASELLAEEGMLKEASEMLRLHKLSRGEKLDDDNPLPEQEGMAAEKTEAGQIQDEMTLRQLMNTKRLEPRYALKLWVYVLRELLKLHNENIIKGTISPENIIIDKDENIRFSGPLAADSHYFAPERIEGLSPDKSSDIYSMGIILYEMLAGSLGFFDSASPSQIMPDVPQWLDEVVELCTKREQQKRFQKIEDIFAALKRLSKQ